MEPLPPDMSTVAPWPTITSLPLRETDWVGTVLDLSELTGVVRFGDGPDIIAQRVRVGAHLDDAVQERGISRCHGGGAAAARD